jgi:hypothetical protein
MEMASQCWMQACLSCIGEQYTGSENVLGFVVNYRRNAAKYFLWTKEVEEEETMKTIGKELRQILGLNPGIKIEYFNHGQLLKGGKGGLYTA